MAAMVAVAPSATTIRGGGSFARSSRRRAIATASASPGLAPRAPRQLRATPSSSRARVRVCLAPRAVKTGPDDLKVSREDGDVRGSSSGKPGSSVINDAADVDGTHCTLEEGAVECTTEEIGDGGGDGGDKSGEGGSGGGSGGGSEGGSEGGSGGSPGSPSPSSELLTFAGWAASRSSERAARADVAAGLSGSARVAAASLFGLNLAAASLARAATRKQNETSARGAARPAPDSLHVVAAPETETETSAVSDSNAVEVRARTETDTDNTDTETASRTNEDARLDAAARRWEREEARRRAAAGLAEASVDESVDAVVRTVGAALASRHGSPTVGSPQVGSPTRARAKEATTEPVEPLDAASAIPIETVGITALSSVTPPSARQKRARGPDDAEATPDDGSETERLPSSMTLEDQNTTIETRETHETDRDRDPLGERGVRFAVIPGDATDPRVIAALRDAAEAQVAAAAAMRAASAATRAAAEATDAAQRLQSAIASGADEGVGRPRGEDKSLFANEGASTASRAARAHARAAADAAETAERAANASGRSGAYLDAGLETRGAFEGTDEGKEDVSDDASSAGRRVARAAGGAAARAARFVGAGVVEGARRVVPAVASGVCSAVETHGPAVRREFGSLGARAGAALSRAWNGVDETVVRRNGRSETVRRAGARERLGAAFAALRRASGLYRGHDEDDAERGERKRRARKAKAEEERAAKA